jgi:serine/threonine-protein kinase
MSLTTGTQLGSYEVISLLGRGGMGEVYRARDTKLKREVAIKTLPEEFSRDPERLARFQREAEALAALNHPGIAHVYGLEESANTRCIVMELVEGETLQQRLTRGAIPVEEALQVAKQIAEALEAAHERGIIHRDLKPGNIMLAADSKVKVLDFGLAKALQEQQQTNLSNSPTMLSAASMTGVILGTAAYMSPEQARGSAVDKRVDVWAFGVVLYEMLGGKPAFHGETTSDILAAVLKEEPDWISLRVQPLLRRCLVKDPKHRLRDIGEARIVIEEGLSGAPLKMAETASGRGNIVWVAVAVALAIIAVIGWATAWRDTPSPDRPLVRLDVDLGSEVTLPSLEQGERDVILSPDGARLVYVSGNPQRLYTRQLDQSKVTELPGTATEHFLLPFFSPDGQWVAFFTEDMTKLNKISVEGSAVVPLADFGTPMLGGSWGADGKIIVGGYQKGLLQVTEGGGAPTTVLEVAPGDSLYVFSANLAGRQSGLVLELDTGSQSRQHRGVFLRRSPSGDGSSRRRQSTVSA